MLAFAYVSDAAEEELDLGGFHLLHLWSDRPVPRKDAGVHLIGPLARELLLSMEILAE